MKQHEMPLFYGLYMHEELGSDLTKIYLLGLKKCLKTMESHTP